MMKLPWFLNVPLECHAVYRVLWEWEQGSKHVKVVGENFYCAKIICEVERHDSMGFASKRGLGRGRKRTPATARGMWRGHPGIRGKSLVLEDGSRCWIHLSISNNNIFMERKFIYHVIHYRASASCKAMVTNIKFELKVKRISLTRCGVFVVSMNECLIRILDRHNVSLRTQNIKERGMKLMFSLA